MVDAYDEDYPEDYENETPRRYCEDCRVLTEALQDMEQQCREAENEGLKENLLYSSSSIDALTNREDEYLAKLNKLQRRRDCALEVLLKHQGLEHAGR